MEPFSLSINVTTDPLILNFIILSGGTIVFRGKESSFPVERTMVDAALEYIDKFSVEEVYIGGDVTVGLRLATSLSARTPVSVYCQLIEFRRIQPNA